MVRKHRRETGGGEVVTVDFTDVETRELLPDEDYIAKVIEITEEEGDKGPYLNWVLKVSKGEYKGKTLYYITSLTKQSLWNLRAVLEALGQEVPPSVMKLRLKEYTGLEMGVSVESEKYKGKMKNVIVDVFNPEDEGEEEGSPEEDKDEDERSKSKDRRSEDIDDDDEHLVSSKHRKARDEDESDRDDEKPRRKSRIR